jgi:hypothetical protein
MVVWLCSERASYVIGAAYNVDGGWMATRKSAPLSDPPKESGPDGEYSIRPSPSQ